MNRVLGDYMETMLYKVFVSIDEHTTVNEVSRIVFLVYCENIYLSNLVKVVYLWNFKISKARSFKQIVNGEKQNTSKW